MNTQEKLERIKARCQELLVIAEKRTPGEWEATRSSYMVPIAKPSESSAAVAMFGIYEQLEGVSVLKNHEQNAIFITACAGPAEAGWRATIAAIDTFNAIRLANQGGALSDWQRLEKMVQNILTAWPDELL